MHLFDALYGRRIKRRPAETADRPADLRPAPDNAMLPLEVERRSQPAALPEQPRRGRGFRRSKPKA